MGALRVFKTVGLAGTLVVGGYNFAQAALINIGVTNAGFEDPLLASPGGFTTSAPGWISTGATGVFEPLLPTTYATVPEGAQVAYIHEIGSLHQVLGAQLVGGATYTLSINVGDRGDADFFGNQLNIGTYRIALYLEDAGNPGDLGAATLLGDATTPLPADGGFATSTVNYLAPGTLGALAGRNLIVALFGGVNPAPEVVNQVNFDDVQLTQFTEDQPEPPRVVEPAALAMFGLGLAGLCVTRRRRCD